MILCIKHIDIEGPGTLGDFLKEKGFRLKILDVGKGDRFPEMDVETRHCRVSTENIEAVVCLGGPMNVYEEDQYPFLKKEDIFIKEILAKEVPFLGICLGAQLLAKACGAKVVKSPVKEVGFFKVQVTSQGLRDHLFKDVKQEFEVYHWHEDMFEIPREGSLLATAGGCPHQAFKIGRKAYGLQFHVEITDKSIREWSEEYLGRHPDFLSKKEEMLTQYKTIQESFQETAQKIYNNFLKVIT